MFFLKSKKSFTCVILMLAVNLFISNYIIAWADSAPVILDSVVKTKSNDRKTLPFVYGWEASIQDKNISSFKIHRTYKTFFSNYSSNTDIPAISIKCEKYVIGMKLVCNFRDEADNFMPNDSVEYKVQSNYTDGTISEWSPVFTENYKATSWLIIQQSATDKNVVDKPAQFLFTVPSNTANYYAIDGAMILNLIPFLESGSLHSFSSLGPSVEYHKNTLTSKATDTLASGLQAAWLYQKWYMHYFNVNLVYKDDNVAKNQSFQGALYYSPLLQSLRIDHDNEIINNVMLFYWLPTIGIEEEQIFSSSKNGPTGNVIRSTGKLYLSLNPSSEKTNPYSKTVKKYHLNNIVLSFTGNYWYNMYKSGGVASGKYHYYYLNPALLVYLDQDKHFGVGVDYINGENPTTNTPLQKYWQFGLKVKF